MKAATLEPEQITIFYEELCTALVSNISDNVDFTNIGENFMRWVAIFYEPRPMISGSTLGGFFQCLETFEVFNIYIYII